MKDAKLLALKEKIESAKEKKQQLTGRRDQLLETLKKDYDCNTIEEAEEKLEKLYAKHEHLETKLQEQVDGLKEKYDIEL